ncbi:hypothetical protein BpHYR1_002112 [Brachionus plicatilis]|uniref:Uncharacterized protein n=1 Tax=Brachionus plicatilis TaxID=10195 RepID=A0A3M7T985_BRAPC|nr:hypothetical protein BpHYR1_002112 [Brachionus plicatilis]
MGGRRRVLTLQQAKQKVVALTPLVTMLHLVSQLGVHFGLEQTCRVHVQAVQVVVVVALGKIKVELELNISGLRVVGTGRELDQLVRVEKRAFLGFSSHGSVLVHWLLTIVWIVRVCQLHAIHVCNVHVTHRE